MQIYFHSHLCSYLPRVPILVGSTAQHCVLTAGVMSDSNLSGCTPLNRWAQTHLGRRDDIAQALRSVPAHTSYTCHCSDRSRSLQDML